MQIYPSEDFDFFCRCSGGGLWWRPTRQGIAGQTHPSEALRPLSVTTAAAVVDRFPPDPAEPRFGKQPGCYATSFCFGAGGLTTTQSSVTCACEHDPANGCLVTDLLRIAAG